VIGTGALGCSVASLVRGRGLATEVVGVDQQSAHLEMARRLGFIHRGLDDPARGVMGSEAVILAVPLDKLFVILEKAAPQMRPGALLTCTAGTPRRLCKQIITEIPTASSFVPSFPLVFSDSHGPAAASSALLMGKQCMVGSDEEFSSEMIERVQQFWSALGMIPSVEDMEQFEWSVTGRHFWPLIVSSTVSEMARKRNWHEGHTVLNRWLQSVTEPDDLERSYQLNATKLSALLDELGKQISRRSRSLGGGTTIPKLDAEKPGPEDASD
jgi:hypothetical protein